MPNPLLVVVLTVATVAPTWSGQVLAADEPEKSPPLIDPEKRDEAERMAREGLKDILQALELFIQSIPQYEMPEVTPEGDIIIRRKRPDRPERPAPGTVPPPEVDETAT